MQNVANPGAECKHNGNSERAYIIGKTFGEFLKYFEHIWLMASEQWNKSFGTVAPHHYLASYCIYVSVYKQWEQLSWYRPWSNISKILPKMFSEIFTHYALIFLQWSWNNFISECSIRKIHLTANWLHLVQCKFECFIAACIYKWLLY